MCSTAFRALEMSNVTEKTILENKIRELEFSKGRLEREKNSLEGELAASQKEVIGLKCSIAEMSSASAGMRAELESVQRQLQSEKSDNCQLRDNLSTANSEILELQVRVIWWKIWLLFSKLIQCYRLVYVKKKL